jgi:anti-sigma B factor antagonist
VPKITKKTLEPDIVVLEIVGRITLGQECQDVEWAVEDLVKSSGKKFIFDLTGLNYIDSTGIGIIVMCSGKIRTSGGELRLASLQPRIMELIAMTQVNKILKCYPTVADARENFNLTA